MRLRVIAAMLLALLPGHALAFDAAKANRYPSPDLNAPNANDLTIYNSFRLGTAPGSMKPGPATSIRSTSARGDWWFEDSAFPLKNEAAIWPNTFTYWSHAISKEFNASNTQDNGNSNFSPLGLSGPNTPLFLWANANNAHGAVVANMTVCVTRTANDVCFGGNDVARNGGSAASGSKLVGREIDVEPAANTLAGPGSAGLVMNIFSDSTSYVPAFQVGGVGGGSWADGLTFDHVRGAAVTMQANSAPVNWLIYGRNGTYNNAAISLGKGQGAGISIGGATEATSTYLYGDANDNFVVHPTANGGSLILLTATPGSDANTRYPASSSTMGTGLASRTVETGTIGYLPYVQGSAAGAVNELVINPSGGNVGIGGGNSIPGAKLDVAGTMRGKMLALAAAPTTTDIPASYWTVVKRSDDASVKLCANDNGTIKCAVMQ